MFKINYVFQKGGPTYKKEYPREKFENNNIFIFKGRNDKGKSTVLQMVALGILGKSGIDKDEEIDEEIKNKVKRLLSDSVDRCEFQFLIESFDQKMKIESGLKDKHIETKLNGKVVGTTNMTDKFKLLLDTPTNPMKKLNSALKSIENNFREYEVYVQIYNNQVRTILESLSNEKNRFQRIKELNSQIDRQKRSNKILEKRIETLEERFKEIKDAYTVFAYTENLNKFRTLDEQKKSYTKKITTMKNAGYGGPSAEYVRLTRAFMDCLINLQMEVNSSKELTNILGKDEKETFLKIKKEVSAIESYKDVKDEKVKKWYDFLNSKRAEIEHNPVLNKKRVEDQELDIINKLLDVLKNSISVDVKIPGTTGKNILEFFEELEKQKEVLEKGLADKLDLKNAQSKCSCIMEDLSKVVTAKAQIPNIKLSDGESYGTIVNAKRAVEAQLNEVVANLTSLEKDCEKIPDFRRSHLLSQKIDYKKFIEKQNEIKSLTKTFEDDNIQIQTNVKLLDEINKPQSVKSKLKEEELKKLYSSTSNLLRKISLWSDLVKSISLEESDLSLDEEQKVFYESISCYLAKVIKLVYFESKSWKVEKVDFIHRCYRVEGRKKPIEFVDIGTGHNELNSLMARLKQNYGNKQKIVLFDEVGVMDKSNLNILIEEIKSQIKSGHTLFALLTRADDDLEEVVAEPIKLE